MLLKFFPSDRSLARAALAGLLVVALVVCFSEPGHSPWLPSCMFFKLTGLYCPGCGSTRMLYALLHGHPMEALRDNALSMLALPVVLYALVSYSFRPALPSISRISSPWSVALAATIILFTIARNLPAEPFYKLVPAERAPCSAAHNRRQCPSAPVSSPSSAVPTLASPRCLTRCSGKS